MKMKFRQNIKKSSIWPKGPKMLRFQKAPKKAMSNLGLWSDLSEGLKICGKIMIGKLGPSLMCLVPRPEDNKSINKKTEISQYLTNFNQIKKKPISSAFPTKMILKVKILQIWGLVIQNNGITKTGATMIMKSTATAQIKAQNWRTWLI